MFNALAIPHCHAEVYADSVEELYHDLRMSSITPPESLSEQKVLLRQAMSLERGDPDSLMDASNLPGSEGCPERMERGWEVPPGS